MSAMILKNAVLIDGHGSARFVKSILVEDDRIAAIETNADIPQRDGAIVHDLAGKTVMPGMVAGHFHASYHDVGAGPGIASLEAPPAYSAYRSLANARLALRHGFTSAVGAGTSFDIDASLAAAIEDGLVEGPRLIPCSRLILSGDDGGSFPWWIAMGEHGPAKCDGVEGMRAMVRGEMNRGARIIKLSIGAGHATPGSTDHCHFTYDEVRCAVETAHDRGVRVRAHVTGKESIRRALDAGVDILDHADWLDDEMIEAVVKADVPVLPSLYLPYRLVQLNKAPFLPDIAAYQNVLAYLRKASEAGVKLCVGDDYGVFITPHGDYAKELAVYVEEAGIAPLEVIKWATVNGAALTLDGNEPKGITVGALADLIVVDGDPGKDIHVLQDVRNIEAVMVGGRLMAFPGEPAFGTTADKPGAPRAAAAA